MLAFLSVLGFLAIGSTDSYHLGGPRKVDAVVKHDSAGFQCELSFIPVACFDPATNRQVNLAKSREFALQSLAKAAGVTNGNITVTKLMVVRPLEIKDSRASILYKADHVEAAATVVVSADKNNSVVAKTPNNTPPVETVTQTVKEQSLLSCLVDMRSTLQEVNTRLLGAVSALIPDAGLDESVADLEQTGVKSFERLEADAKAEKLLLTIEKSDLTAEIGQRHRAFLDSLTAAYVMLNLQKSQSSKP